MAKLSARGRTCLCEAVKRLPDRLTTKRYMSDNKILIKRKWFVGLSRAAHTTGWTLSKNNKMGYTCPQAWADRMLDFGYEIRWPNGQPQVSGQPTASE